MLGVESLRNFRTTVLASFLFIHFRIELSLACHTKCIWEIIFKGACRTLELGGDLGSFFRNFKRKTFTEGTHRLPSIVPLIAIMALSFGVHKRIYCYNFDQLSTGIWLKDKFWPYSLTKINNNHQNKKNMRSIVFVVIECLPFVNSLIVILLFGDSRQY